jgi:hypothetical protein
VKLKWDFSLPVFLDFIGVVERREDFVSFGNGVLTYIGGMVFFVFNEVVNSNFRLLNFLRSNQFFRERFNVRASRFEEVVVLRKMLQ